MPSADFIYDDERANEIHEEIRKRLRDIDLLYMELRNLGYVKFKSDIEKEKSDETSD